MSAPPREGAREGAREEPRELRLDLPAAHSAERMARSVLREFARREGLPRAEIDTLEFVAGELLTNAVDHGGGGRARSEADLKDAARMTLCFTLAKDGWTLRVGDQGGGDASSLRRRVIEAGGDAPPDLEDDRGRGFFLLAQMLDRLDVLETADGRGVEFVAVKRLVPS